MEANNNKELKVRRFDIEDSVVQALILGGSRINDSVHKGFSPDFGCYVVVDIGTSDLTVVSER